jgi:hypothetical protein
MIRNHTAGPEGHDHLIALLPGINPRPTALKSFSAAFKAQDSFATLSARLKSCPDTKQVLGWTSVCNFARAHQLMGYSGDVPVVAHCRNFKENSLGQG